MRSASAASAADQSAGSAGRRPGRPRRWSARDRAPGDPPTRRPVTGRRLASGDGPPIRHLPTRHRPASDRPSRPRAHAGAARAPRPDAHDRRDPSRAGPRACTSPPGASPRPRPWRPASRALRPAAMLRLAARAHPADRGTHRQGRRPARPHDQGLLECDFGDWTGRKLSELRKLPGWSDRPALPQRRSASPAASRSPRCSCASWNALERLVAAHRGQTVVAVSHADPIKAAVRHALGGAPRPVPAHRGVAVLGHHHLLSTAGGPVVLDGELHRRRPQHAGAVVSTGESFEFERPRRPRARGGGRAGRPGLLPPGPPRRPGRDAEVREAAGRALGRYLGQLAQAIGPADPDRDVVGLVEPVQEAWVVGQLSVGVDEANGRILVTAEEMVTGDFEVEVGLDVSDEDVEALIEAAEELMDEPAEARSTLTPGQALAFGEQAEELLAAGRPACRLCGAPIDPEGHACPRWN